MSRAVKLRSGLTPAVLDDLERRALAEGLLVRQVPESPGLYEVSDGRAFHATPIAVLPEMVAERGRLHDAAVAGRTPLIKKPSASLTPAKELATPLGESKIWRFTLIRGDGSSDRAMGEGRTFFAAREHAARRLQARRDPLCPSRRGTPIEPGDLRLVGGRR